VTYVQLSSVSEDLGIYSRMTAANIVDVRMKEKWQRDQRMAMKGKACAVQLATVLVLVPVALCGWWDTRR
jgi:hypothetical protein